ncbi:hypothetical protein [Allorhizobium ampelinum]|uniref:hypothetical protein n=1 Tax=Allorhizobium ampelinum TaxID=3025782 RepID=UPI001F37FA44|nr:hypothetical protein [Allorhizobium ampelinum]
MTMSLEMQIEELRLRNAVYQTERQWILNGLAAAEVQLAEEEAAFEALMKEEPPE